MPGDKERLDWLEQQALIRSGNESVLGCYRLVPIEPPITLLPHLTGFDSVHWMDEHDRNVILERLRSRWAGILDALAPPDVQQAPGSEGEERRPRP